MRTGNEDDIYEGFNQIKPQQLNLPPPSTASMGAPPGTGFRAPPTSGVRGGGLASRGGLSRAGGPPGDDVRPITAVRAAGYTAAGQRAAGGTFDPANMGSAGRGPAPPLQKRADNSPEDKCREMEKEVNGLIEESAILSLQKHYQAALEKAKEAGKLEKSLRKTRCAHILTLWSASNFDCCMRIVSCPFSLA